MGLEAELKMMVWRPAVVPNPVKMRQKLRPSSSTLNIFTRSGVIPAPLPAQRQGKIKIEGIAQNVVILPAKKANSFPLKDTQRTPSYKIMMASLIQELQTDWM